MKLTLLLIAFCCAVRVHAIQNTNGENPYNWIVDNARDAPGARVYIMKAVLRHGFEHSVLLREAPQGKSIIWVSFDEDVLRADKDFWKSWGDYTRLVERAVKCPKEVFLYELSAEIEIRPFPNIEARNGKFVEVGYGHMGAFPLGIVVKRIYTLKEIEKSE